MVVTTPLWIGHHRRFTANHTWHLDWMGRPLFVKVNPHRSEALAEYAGHVRVRPHYPVPRLRCVRRLGRWTALAYDRWLHLGADYGLLLDTITHAGSGAGSARLDRCLTDLISYYRKAIGNTLRQVPSGLTVAKLYGDRAAPGGRLDQYYRADAPWPVPGGSGGIRPSALAGTQLIVNGRKYRLDFAELLTTVRAQFDHRTLVWAAVTQGDPTDFNIGWTPDGGPVWFDFDTGGFNALAGEFACFMLYQRLHGPWLTPVYNRAAFHDHPSAMTRAACSEPAVDVRFSGSALAIDYEHRPTPIRLHVLGRYVDELVGPVVRRLGIDDVMGWLRPYLVLRLVGVYDLTALRPRDTALALALLAEILDPTTTLPDFLALPCP